MVSMVENISGKTFFVDVGIKSVTLYTGQAVLRLASQSWATGSVA